MIRRSARRADAQRVAIARASNRLDGSGNEGHTLASSALPRPATETATVGAVDLAGHSVESCGQRSSPHASVEPTASHIDGAAGCADTKMSSTDGPKPSGTLLEPGDPIELHHAGGRVFAARLEKVLGDVAWIAVRGCGLYRLRLRSTGKRYRAGRFEDRTMACWCVSATTVARIRATEKRDAERRQRVLKRGRR